MICLILHSYAKSDIYTFWYNFDTVLYEFLETGTSDRCLIYMGQLLRFTGFSLNPLSFFSLQIQSISSCFNILKVSSVHNIIHTGIWVVISSLLSEHGYLSNLITIVLQYTSYYILIYHRREIIFSYSLPFIWLQHGIILFYFFLKILHGTGRLEK